MIVTCVTKHAFQGNSLERQVSFSAGERVTYDTAQATDQGWLWVRLESFPTGGWCPQTYLMPPNNGPMVQPPASAAPIAEDVGDGFFGSIMGGSANPQPASQNSGEASFERETPVSTTTGAPVRGRRVKGALQKLGTNMQQAGQKSWRAVSNGAQTAGNIVSNGASKSVSVTKEGVQGLQKKQQTISNKPWYERSAGEQRAIDMGNHAARGAVHNAIYSGIMSGGNPMAAARGATCGAVGGGAYGAVKRWKPFG